MEVPQKLKIELPYDPAISLLGIYSKKTKTLIQKDICSPMFTAAVVTTVKTQSSQSVNQPNKGWRRRSVSVETDRHRHTHTHTDTHTQTHTDTETHTHTHRRRDTHTHTQRHTDTDTHT